MVNTLDHPVFTGPKDSDEMCVYYVMYYVENFGQELTSDMVSLLGAARDRKGLNVRLKCIT